MSPSPDNLLFANRSVTLANQANNRRLFAAISSGVVFGLSIWLTNVSFDPRDAAWPLAIVMLMGPIAAAVWRRGVDKSGQIGRTLLLGLALALASCIVAFVAGHSLASYTLFKAMKWAPFILPFIAGFGYYRYQFKLVTSWSWDWRLALDFGLSLLGPWVWTAGALYGAYKHA